MWPKWRTSCTQHGFTLLEVMVALAVFAIVAALAYRGLDSIATTRVRLDQEMRMWRELELVFERIGLDASQTAPRSWKDSDNKERTAVQGESSTGGTECQLDLVRFATDHSPLHVRYQMKREVFSLDVIPDVGINAQTVVMADRNHYVLLNQVERCELAFLDTSNDWQDHWPLKSTSDTTRPRGIRLRLTLADRGVFERMYYMP